MIHVIAVTLQATQNLSSPPSPLPLPQSGEIHCQIRDKAGNSSNLDGVLGLSGPRGSEHQRSQVVNFRSNKLTDLDGQADVTWTKSGGDLLLTKYPFEQFVTFKLAGQQRRPGRTAIAIEIRNYKLGTARYFAGLCEHSLSPYAAKQ